MKLSETLKLKEMQSAVAGTQATVADSRKSDEWLKNYLDAKNKRLNDLRVQLNYELGPEKGGRAASAKRRLEDKDRNMKDMYSAYRMDKKRGK
jgi:hypothetical protein